MSTLPPILVELKANAGEFMAKMGEARHEVAKLETESAGHVSKFAALGKASLLGLAGVTVGVGGAALEMADTLEKSRARLEGALANAGSSFEELRPHIKAVDKQLEKLGYTNAETESSLAMLTNATHNPAKALGEMGLAADIARGRNISLDEATGILMKVQTGHVALLGRLGIATKDASGHIIDQHEALARLSAMYGGDAQRNADTFAGKQAAMRATASDLAAQLGLVLIPKIEELIGWVQKTVGWFQEHTTTAKALAAVIGGVLAVAIGATLVESLGNLSKALTLTGRAAQLFGVQAAEGETAAELPLLPWIAAIALVGLAAYELYKHWDQVWGFIKDVARGAVDFLRSHLALIITLALGPVGLAIYELYKHWDQVWGFITRITSEAWSHIKNAFVDGVKFVVDIYLGMAVKITQAAATAFGWIPGIGGKLKEAAAAVTAFKDHVNAQLDAIKDKTVTVTIQQVTQAVETGTANKLKNTPPGFADGVRNFSGGLALVGERGPELVELPRGTNVYPHGTGPAAATTTNNYNVQLHTNTVAQNPRDVAQELAWLLKTST